jgi:hypothetical protein
MLLLWLLLLLLCRRYSFACFAADVAAFAVDAIMAIENTEIGEQDFEQGNAPAIGGIGVANAHAAC